MEKILVILAVIAVEFLLKNLVIIKKLLGERVRGADILVSIIVTLISATAICCNFPWVIPVAIGGLISLFQLLAISFRYPERTLPKDSLSEEIWQNIIAIVITLVVIMFLSLSSILASGYCYYKNLQSEKELEETWKNTPAIVVEYDNHVIDGCKVINDSTAINAKDDFRVLKLQKGDSIKYLKQEVAYGLPVERLEIITIGGEKVTKSTPSPML